jgi:hypothetical protein
MSVAPRNWADCDVKSVWFDEPSAESRAGPMSSQNAMPATPGHLIACIYSAADKNPMLPMKETAFVYRGLRPVRFQMELPLLRCLHRQRALTM